MAGAAPTPSGKGGRKPLDAPINLVPFIDLLSCCITFLIMTAVWTQMAAMETKQPASAADSSGKEKPKPSVVLTLEVNPNELLLMEKKNEEEPKSTHIDNKDGSYDLATLTEEAKRLRDKYPGQTLVFRPYETLPYLTLIAVMECLPLYKENTNDSKDRDGFRIQLAQNFSQPETPPGGAK